MIRYAKILSVMLGQEPFRIQRGHKAAACRRNGLAVNAVLHVTAGENAMYGGLGCARNDLQVTELIIIPSGNPGKLSTSVVVVNLPPGRIPSITSGATFALAR
ncbi:hypothetical protein ASG93_30900 [Paenibacillus sp. Soil787]|nr:hypothetical protein ASG93_30900 [Paenibacillus sp. Soil787]